MDKKGFPILGDTTAPVALLAQQAMRGRNGTRRRKKKTTTRRKKTATRRAAPRRKKKGVRLKKGSAAAKAWGAKMRRLRKRR